MYTHAHSSLYSLSHTTRTDMANIFALLLICMYIFAILGYSFFGENCPKHFGSLGSCMLPWIRCIASCGASGEVNCVMGRL